MALVGRFLVDLWNTCVSGLRRSGDDPEHEEASVQNCWSWALKRWLIYGGKLIIYPSPRARILRCVWEDRSGRLWHFEPTHPKRGVKAIWHAYLHEGRPKNLR